MYPADQGPRAAAGAFFWRDPLAMLRSLFRLLAQFGRSPRDAAPPRRRVLPRVELLENRLVPTTIAGIVYNDFPGVGNFILGDQLYAGNSISLLNQAGTPIASTITDANGHYAFTINQTINTTPTTSEQDLVFSSPTDVTQSQQVNQFDPSLGTLTAVEIVQDAKITSSIKVDNLDAIASTVEGKINGTVTLQAAGVSPLKATLKEVDESATVNASDGTMGFTGAAAHDFGPKDAPADHQDVILDAAKTDLSSFIGTGKATVSESGTADVCVCGPGNLLSLVKSTVSGQTKIIYYYTPSNALTPGQYIVVQNQNPPGTFEGTNTSNGVPVPIGTPADTIPITLPPAGDSLNNDFGERTPPPIPIPPPPPPGPPPPPTPIPPPPVPPPTPIPPPPPNLLSKFDFLGSTTMEWGF
jgi:hypothetical protein